MNRTRLQLSVLIVSGTVAALIFGPALDATLQAGGGLGRVAAAAFDPFCHQLPERGLFLGGAQLAVCVRCLGLYLGFFLGWMTWSLRPGQRRPISNRALAAGLTPLAFDGLTNALGIWTSPAPLRLGVGLLFGATIARAIGPALLEAFSGVRPAAPLVAEAVGRGEDYFRK